MITRILVPVDFSTPSLQALDYAVEFGRPFKPEFVVLHVLEPIYYPALGDMYGPGYDIGLVYRELERAGREQLSRVAATLQEKRLTVRTLLRVGTAYHVIVETAKKVKADVIIMSTHGRTGFSHMLMGSVAEKVVRSAGCPVLTVRGDKGHGRQSQQLLGSPTAQKRRPRRGASAAARAGKARVYASSKRGAPSRRPRRIRPRHERHAFGETVPSPARSSRMSESRWRINAGA